MKDKGFVSGPFQLMINVIILGMALTIGFYLYDNIQCWKCNTQLDAELIDLRENIASVGKGDINSKKHDIVKVEDLGTCAKAIYIKQIREDENYNCRSFCPNHPNSCWVLWAERRCGDKNQNLQCIDISGDTKIESDILPQITDPSTEELLRDSWYIGSSTPISIKKTAVDTISLTKVGD
jgi:hypothetical protein